MSSQFFLDFPLNRQIVGIGRRVHPRRHVYELTINYTIIDKLLRYVLGSLLRNTTGWVFTCFPKLCLPDKVFLKILHEPEDEVAFKREMRAYSENRHLQGHLIPYYYGQVVYGSERAILVSEARGVPLSKLFPEHYTQALLDTRAGYDRLSENCIVHGDAALDHIFWDGKQVMFIDFDCAEFESPPDEAKETNEADYQFLKRRLLKTEKEDLKLVQEKYLQWFKNQ